MDKNFNGTHVRGGSNNSGQISSRPHRSFGPPKGVWEGKSPTISGKSRLVQYYNLARTMQIYGGFEGFPLQKCLVWGGNIPGTLNNHSKIDVW